MSREDITNKLFIITQSAEKSLNSLSKSDLVEIKAFRAPPTAVLQASEAICILLSKTPDFSTFRKTADSTDFIRKLIEYDKDAISDYTLNELNKYINNPNFYPEHIAKYSKLASGLCEWSRAMYEYGTLKKKIDQMNLDSSDCTTLVEFMIKNSCFTFSWSLSYGDLNSKTDEIEEVNKFVEILLTKLDPLLTQDEFFDLFDEDTNLVDLQFIYPKLPLNVLRSCSAKGKFVLVSNYVITDLKWFSSILETLVNGPNKSDCDYSIEKLIGKNISIWTEKELKENLYLTNSKVINLIIFIRT